MTRKGAIAALIGFVLMVAGSTGGLFTDDLSSTGLMWDTVWKLGVSLVLLGFALRFLALEDRR